MTAPWHYGRSTQNSEEMLSRLYRRLKVSNHIPSRYEAWEDGDSRWSTSSPTPCSSRRRGRFPEPEEHGIDEAFRIQDAALNGQASGRDPQGGGSEDESHR